MELLQRFFFEFFTKIVKQTKRVDRWDFKAESLHAKKTFIFKDKFLNWQTFIVKIHSINTDKTKSSSITLSDQIHIK